MINNIITINLLLFISFSLVLYFKNGIILRVRFIETYLGFFNFIAAFLIFKGSNSSLDTLILLTICFFNILLIHDFGLLINSLIPKRFKKFEDATYFPKYFIYNGRMNKKNDSNIDVHQLYFKKLVLNVPQDYDFVLEKDSLKKFFIEENKILAFIYLCFGIIQLALII